MANLPISGLPTASALDGTELLPFVQGGVTTQANVQDILDADLPLTSSGVLVNGFVNVSGSILTQDGLIHIVTPDPATNFIAIDFRNVDNFGIYGKSNSIAGRGNTLEFTATDYNINGDILTHEVLTLRPEGNVGIGTTDPSNTLEVIGGVTATSFTGSLLGSATNSTSASYAVTASHALNAGIQSTTGSWSVPPGASMQGFTVDFNRSYQMWVIGNIPNGIISWNATVNVTNGNVPVVGNQYGWYYTDGGALVLTSIPSQIVGENNIISTASVVTTTANTFEFGITNNSGVTQTINYGYIKL
jgi:hypothetical protein